MKFKLITLIVLCIFATSVNAQIDRSTMPKPGPAPKVNIGEPDRFNLRNGLEVLVVENHKLPRISASLIIDNKPYTADKPGTSSLVSSLLGTGTENISKDEFNEEIDFLGARVSFGSESAFASSLSKYFPRILELMAEGALNPLFTQEEFEAEKTKLIEGLKTDEKSVAAIGSRVASALAYGKNHPYGQFVTPETVEAITLKDVQNTYRNYFVPENAYMVIVGDITKREAKKLVKEYFSDWKKATPPNVSLPTVKNAQYAQINFVDMPNAVQSQITVENTVDLQMNNPDYFPVLVANQILGGSFGSYLNMNLREDKGYTYGARSSIGASRYASRFTASASVRNAVTDSAVVEFLKEIKRIRTEDVDAEKLEDVKSKFAGNFVMRLERPSTIANYALNIETNNLPEDFYETYLEKINAVSVEDVKRVAQKYLKLDKVRVVIAGKGVDVAENLEKIKFNEKKLPVLYYDKKANKTDKPEFKKPLPEGVTVATIYEDYINAIGGREKAEEVNSIYMKGSASMQGMKLALEQKMTKDGKQRIALLMNGNPLSLQVFNGESGYIVQQGQRIEMTDEQIKTYQATSGAIPELSVSDDAELTGIENVNGQDAYAIKMSENMTEYYSTETGLKLQTKTVVEQMGRSMETLVMYDDYKEVNGVMMPHILTQSFGPRKLDFNMNEVKINEGVSDKDFE